MKDATTVIDFGPFRARKQDYQYGEYLAGHGIGLEELSKDWPEVLECEDVMRGYREAWKCKGYGR